MVRITKRVVDAAEARDKRYVLFDEDVRGFGLRVFPSGAKSWIFEYRPPNGGRTASKRRVLIGQIADFTPDQARKVADQFRTTVKTGGDPQAAKNEWRTSPTLKQVAEAFLEHIEENRAEATFKGYERVLRVHVLPRLGTKKARDVEHHEVAKLHRDMKPTPAQANSMLRVLGSLYAWAEKAQERRVPKGTNPTVDIERYVELPREVELSDEELIALGDALRLAETVGVPWVTDPEKKSKHLRKDLAARVTVLDVYTAAAIRLLLFTGARLREILGLRWSDIDWKNGLATAWKHKYTRTKGKKVITLNPPAMQLLADLDEKEQELEKLQGWRSEFIVAGKYIDAPRADLQNPWNAVRRHASLPNLRLHDLRHNFASFGLGGNMDLAMIGKLLGHASTQSTERYAHLRRDPQRQATADIGRALANAIGEGAPTKDNIEKLPSFITKS